MYRYLTGLLCCGGAVVYLLFYTLESRGEPAALRRLRGAAPRALISSSHGNGFSTNAGSASTKVPDATFRLHGDDDECDVLLCGMSGVGKSTLLHNIKAGTVEHACHPLPRAWDAFAQDLRLHGPFVDNTFKVRHIDTCRLQCSGCGKTRIKMTADLSVLRRHWANRILAQYKGGVLYAMRKTMWNCLGQWGQGADEDYDLTVNVGLDGRYCVRAGSRANETHA